MTLACSLTSFSGWLVSAVPSGTGIGHGGSSLQGMAVSWAIGGNGQNKSRIPISPLRVSPPITRRLLNRPHLLKVATPPSRDIGKGPDLEYMGLGDTCPNCSISWQLSYILLVEVVRKAPPSRVGENPGSTSEQAGCG